MDSFVGNTRQFFQGLPSSTRGYGGATLKDDNHAPPTPTPPATPTLPPAAHPYHPYQQSITGSVPATSLPGILAPPSRPMTPVTPSHKPPDPNTSGPPYSVTSFLPPPVTKKAAEARYLAQIEHYNQQALAAAAAVVCTAASTRSSDTLHNPRAPSQSHINNQASLSIEPRLASRSYISPQSSVSVEGRSHISAHTTHASSTSTAELRPTRPYISTHSLPSDLRAIPHPYSSQNSSDSRAVHNDSKYFPRPEPRPPDSRIPEARPDPRADLHQEQWSPYRTPDSKSLERLAPSVHIAEVSVSVNGSKDALYLGKKPEEMPVRHPDNVYHRNNIESLQVNGSRDPLYPNGSHSAHSSNTKRDSSSERKAESRPKEDSALDLSVKTVRQTPDSTAPDLEKSHSNSPHGVTIERAVIKDPQRRTPSSIPVTSPYRTPSRDPSPAQPSELSKIPPGISGAARGVSPSHMSQYGVTGSPRPLHSPGPHSRASHMLPPTKRPGCDTSYHDHLPKLPRLSLTPPNKTPTSRHITESHLSDHSRDRSLSGMPDPNRGLNLLATATMNKGLDIRYSGESTIERRPLHSADVRDPNIDWRGRRDLSLERRDLSIERKDPNLDVRRDLSHERREINSERRDSVSRKDLSMEGKDPGYDKRENPVLNMKYVYGKHHQSIALPADSYRNWSMPPEQPKHNSLPTERPKYLPGQQSVPTSVPTSLPQQNSRAPAQLHPYSTFRHPPDTRLPQTAYLQAGHTATAAHPSSQLSLTQSTTAKMHHSYVQPPNSRTGQIPATQSSSHPSQSHAAAAAGQTNSATQPHHYPYPYSQTVAAHYAQRQPRPSSGYPTYGLPPSTKSSSSASLAPPPLTPQQAAQQAYLYAQQHRNDPSLALYQTKRTNQLSPHPSGSPHSSISPHPSASPNTAASPHTSASPHHMITSPHSAVSPHLGQQARIPSQYSPHPTQRSPSASATQHSYQGSLPPSPYAGHQGHTTHTTPPSSRPSSATSQTSHPPQPHSLSQPQRSPYPSQVHSSQSSQSHASHPLQTYPVSSQSHSPHPSHSRTTSQSQPHTSHPSQTHHTQSQNVSSAQSQPGHLTHPHSTHHSQAHIYSQPHPTWSTQPYAGHVTKPTDSHHSQTHPLHNYPPQGYPYHSHAAKPHNSQTNISQSHPPQPHPTQCHPPQPRPTQSHPPQPHPPQSHPPQPHPPQSHPPQPHPPQSHPPQSHPPQPHPPQSHPPQPHPPQSHPPQPHPPQSHPPQPHPPQLHPPQSHPPHSHPPQPRPPQPHPPQSHPPQSHPPQSHPHPPQSHPPQPHPPQSHPPQPHPPQSHPPQPHPPQSHPSQPHPPQSHPPQPHPPQSHPPQPHPPQSHPPQPHPPQSHAPQPHPSQSHPPQPHPSQSHPPQPHPSQSHPPQPRPSQSHPPQPHPSQSHPPQPQSHPSQSHPTQSHPSQSHPPQPHSSQSHPPLAQPSQANPPQVYPSQAHPSRLHPSQLPHPHPPQPHTSQTQPPQGHPQQTHQPQAYSSQPHPSHAYPSHPHSSQPTSAQARSSQAHQQQPHSPRGHPPQSQTISQPQSHSPRGHMAQPHSPRGHSSQGHPPGPPLVHPSQAYPSQDNQLGYPPTNHPSRILQPQTHPTHPQMRLPYPSPIRHPYPPTSQPQPLHPTHPNHPSYASLGHPPHSTPSHISDASQPHPHPGYHHHGHHPYYPPQQLSHPSAKIDAMMGGSQYPPYPYPAQAGNRNDLAPAGVQSHPLNQQAPGVSSTSRSSQDYDLSRIRTKGEQKSFDPRNAESGKQAAIAPESSQTITPLQLSDSVDVKSASTSVTENLQASSHEAGQKASTLCKEEEGNKSDQVQATSKTLEPGKAALAEKLHKKLQHAESMESLVTKKENIPENVVPKKEELPEEDEWGKGFDKLLDDLAANPDGVTSRKCRSLGRRYLQKVQIQNAIDNDLIVPPAATLEEEEEESEPEAPVKFRGKFKSIKDKKVERLILTYASHSDESAMDMIPDDDASDFEEELKREIRLKSKKRGHAKKTVAGDTSSGSDAEKKTNIKRGSGRGRNKENKPNNKQDSDYSLSSSSSESESSSSSSSDDSDSEDTDSEELVRPKRKGKKSDQDQKKRGKNWDSDSSDSEDELIPKRRSRRGRKYLSDEDSFKPSQRIKKRKNKQDSSDSDEIRLKTTRRRKKKKSESEEEEEFIRGRGNKKKALIKKYKKSRKDESDEDSDKEVPRKTRGMRKKIQESKKGKRRKQATSVSSSSESDEVTDKKGKTRIDAIKKKRGKNKKNKSVEDSSEESDIPTKKKSNSKTNLILDSEDESDSDLKKVSSEEKVLKGKEISKVSQNKEDGESEKGKEQSVEKVMQEAEAEAEAEIQEIEEEDANAEPDSVIEKLKKIRDEELSREDVQEMKAWLGEVNRDIKKQLGNLHDISFRHYWKKPQFGGGDDFLHGWQSEVKKYKENTARFPKKLCHAIKHQASVSSSKSSPRKAKDQDSSKDSPSRRGTSSPAKNTRSKSGIIKTNMSLAEDERLKVAARPEISSVMQRFFDKVLAVENGSDDNSKDDSTCRKFTLGSFHDYGGTPRVPTGLTPTPSVAPSMLASDDSDLDSLASLRMDLPASDSVPVSKRSIASSLLKKIGRKYNDKKLNTYCLTKTRSVLEVSNKPQLLPTPGMPTSEKDLEEMSPDQLKLSTFFRKETVNNYRVNFEVIVTKNGINDTPILYQSRTRNKTKQIQDAATVKSVFGADVPPHILKKAEVKKSKKASKKADKKEESKKDESPPIPISRASTPVGSTVAVGEEDDDSELRSERSESVLGESSVSHVPKRVKRKFRKFRSGFDYIRKKKKVKADDENTPSRKRLPVRKHVNWPEQSRDVASEVRAWVVNKGLGETVLHKAARLQYHDVVVFCAESPDFDINVRDNAGYTPLHEACNRGHLDIAQVLCAHGAHVNAPGYKGMRPLHEAVENGHGELARLLLAYGADPTLTTYAGQTCLALSADIQTRQLIEGFMADLKGQRISEKWYFAGSARFLDPEEQGCDIFGNIPGINILQVRELRQCIEASDKTLDDPLKVEISPVDESTNCPDTLNSDRGTSLLKEVKVEGVLNEQNSSLKKSHDPKVTEKTESVRSVKEQQESASETLKDNGEKPEETGAPVNKETSAIINSSDDFESDTEWVLKDLIFETSDLPMLDLFEVDGRPHKYHLMIEVLSHLKMTHKEFVISAKSVETLELSTEEFESRAHSCILGSCSRDIVDSCSRVVLVRVTPNIEKLLGIETVKL